jgi:hypothetical protein
MGYVKRIKMKRRMINIDIIDININMIDMENTWYGI